MMVRLVTMMFLGLAVAACAGPGQSLPPIADAPTGPYRLDSGDQVRMIVFGQEELSGEYTVNDSGTISVPLIGTVDASGRTTAELEQEVADVLSAGLLVNPSVSVEVQAFRPFFILGEVNDPGQYPYVAGMSVLTAVAIGGGFTFRADEETMTITRTTGDSVAEGRASRDTLVQPGDVVYVYERFF